MNETKYTVQLDDKSVLEVNDLHRGLISNQKQALEEYKLEQKGLFSQYKNDLKSVAAGQGLWHPLRNTFYYARRLQTRK